MRMKQKGIALVQVLIISIVLISLGLFISQTVRSQVSAAHTMKNAFELRIKILDVEAKLLQALLSNQRVQDKNSQNEVVRAWNFHNKEFTIDDHDAVNITIQDLSSLVSLNFMDKTIAKSLFSQLGVDNETISIFIDSLTDWKDADDLNSTNGAESSFYREKSLPGPRNGYLQSLSEVAYIRAANMLTFEQWKKETTIESIKSFNPLNSSSRLLLAIIKDESKVKEVLELRAKNKLTSYEFYRITGIDEDEFIRFGTGEKLMITLNSKLKSDAGSQQVTKRFIVTIKSRSILQPIIITDMTWNTL